MKRAGLIALALAALTGACGQSRGDVVTCELTYSMLAGPVMIESQARVGFELNISQLGNTYTVREVTVTAPWTGRGEADPWRLFIVGRERPIAGVEGDVVTLFETDERPFTINRASGDAGWSSSAPMGETEYYGGCTPAAPAR